MYDNQIVLYRSNIDIFFYVVASADENELMISSMLNAFYDAVSTLLRYSLAWTHCFEATVIFKSPVLLQTPTWEAIYPRQFGLGCAVPGRDCWRWVSGLCIISIPYCACVNKCVAYEVSFWKRIPMLSLVVYPSHVWMLPISHWANSRSSKRIRQHENDSPTNCLGSLYINQSNYNNELLIFHHSSAVYLFKWCGTEDVPGIGNLDMYHSPLEWF